MRLKVDSLQLKVKPGNRARREEGTQLRWPFEGHEGNLLIARVKITSYNHPAAAGSAPFFRAPVVSATKSTREKDPTTSSSQPEENAVQS